jgi:hypothetical protein
MYCSLRSVVSRPTVVGALLSCIWLICGPLLSGFHSVELYHGISWPCHHVGGRITSILSFWLVL